jgi:hypothetical protein
MSRIDEAELDGLYRDARPLRDPKLVTVGRAAQMLRMTRQQVRKYILAEMLPVEEIEGPRRRGRQTKQWLLRKKHVRAFRLRLEDCRRRHPTRWVKQLALPIAREDAPPAAWALQRLGAFQPKMLAAKVVDRQLQGARHAHRSTRIA